VKNARVPQKDHHITLTGNKPSPYKSCSCW